MIALSVNVNKIATLRNSRGGAVPSVLDAIQVAVAAGCQGITVHPRADARHITPDDVRAVAGALRGRGGRVELNIEGDPRPDLLALVHEVGPTQCTLVPVRPWEITSEAGWPSTTPVAPLAWTVEQLRAAGIRVSVFVEAGEAPVRWAAELGADRVELYTEPFARAFALGVADMRASFERFVLAAELAHGLGLGVNAGHDLDLENLTMFRGLPRLAEVSIGHALVSHALFVGSTAPSATTSWPWRIGLTPAPGPGSVGDAVTPSACTWAGAPCDIRSRVDRSLGSSMRSESVVFTVAGMCFGVILGWVMGTQQASQVVVPAASPPATAAAPPAAALDEGRVQSLTAIRRERSIQLRGPGPARERVLRRRAVRGGHRLVRAGAGD